MRGLWTKNRPSGVATGMNGSGSLTLDSDKHYPKRCICWAGLRTRGILLEELENDVFVRRLNGLDVEDFEVVIYSLIWQVAPHNFR